MSLKELKSVGIREWWNGERIPVPTSHGDKRIIESAGSVLVQFYRAWESVNYALREKDAYEISLPKVVNFYNLRGSC